MGRRHIIQAVFPETFRKLDRLQWETIKVFVRRVVVCGTPIVRRPKSAAFTGFILPASFFNEILLVLF
jgi:hypothetical protein